MTPEEAKHRSNRARLLLDDPMLKDALDSIENDCIAQWEAVPARDVDGREFVWKLYKTAKKFRSILQGAIENGKVSEFRDKPTIFDKAVNAIRR